MLFAATGILHSELDLHLMQPTEIMQKGKEG